MRPALQPILVSQVRCRGPTWFNSTQVTSMGDTPVYRRSYRRRLRLAALEAYGNRCACCGEARWEFLTIDHIEGRGAGARERAQYGVGTKDTKPTKKRGSGGYSAFFRDIAKNVDLTKYRVLCMNCNFAVGTVGYCPHSAP